jgi:hypothetical protein
MYRQGRTVIVGFRIPASVVEAMRMPAIVIAVMVVHADGARLAVSSGLRPAAMLRRVYCEGGQQQKQHGGYFDLPVCSQIVKHESEK